jgi:prolyl-tRNA editing enzyme YbaK/EbsC (Cys-tRNA(Pro) deacylase)
MKPAIERVARALRDHGMTVEIIEFAQSTRTAEEAAAAVGTDVGSIVKSLVFLADTAPLLVLVSGLHRVSLDRLGAALGMPVRRADAATVRTATGFAIGGVAPVGHPAPLPVLCDADLLRYGQVFAAAGTPNTVFPIAPRDLVRITHARVIDLKEEAAQA